MNLIKLQSIQAYPMTNFIDLDKSHLYFNLNLHNNALNIRTIPNPEFLHFVCYSIGQKMLPTL